ncbi:MAG: hypothetical protein ACXVSF_16230 [Solirubrobacteraceae bacterium]
MSNHTQIRSPGAHEAHEPVHPAQKLDEEVSLAAAVAAGALRAIKVAALLLIALLVCPPLAVFAFLIVAPALVIGLALGLLVAIVSTPYLLFQHFSGHGGGHLSLVAHRVRRAVRALIDLAPHRIVADARKLHTGR